MTQEAIDRLSTRRETLRRALEIKLARVRAEEDEPRPFQRRERIRARD